MTDWDIATQAGDALLRGDLRLYAEMPEAQMGPLALLLAVVMSHTVYTLVVWATMPIFLWSALDGVPPERRTRARLTVSAGAPFLAAPWVRWGIEGHADDVLVLLGAAGLLWALRRHHEWVAVVAFLIAIAGKPTAAVLLPLPFMISRRAGAGALVGAGLIWGPFLLADPHGFLTAGAGISGVSPNSLPDWLGATADASFPAWVRPAQLLGGALLCWWCSRRATFVVGVLAAFTFRALLEPGAWPIYSTAVIAAAILVDARRGRGPMLAAVAFGSWIATAWFFPMNLTEGALRNAALLVLVGVAVALSGGSRERSVDVAAPPTLRRTGEAVDAGMART